MKTFSSRALLAGRAAARRATPVFGWFQQWRRLFRRSLTNTGSAGAATRVDLVAGRERGSRALNSVGMAIGVVAAVVMADPVKGVADERQSLAALLAPVAKDCHAVALETWKHPTRTVLHNHNVELIALQLCNGNHYPVYTVRFVTNPMGNNDGFFNPFYARMAEANGFWPFAFVDLADHEVVWIESKPGVRDVKIEHDEYAPP